MIYWTWYLVYVSEKDMKKLTTIAPKFLALAKSCGMEQRRKNVFEKGREDGWSHRQGIWIGKSENSAKNRALENIEHLKETKKKVPDREETQESAVRKTNEGKRQFQGWTGQQGQMLGSVGKKRWLKSMHWIGQVRGLLWVTLERFQWSGGLEAWFEQVKDWAGGMEMRLQGWTSLYSNLPVRGRTSEERDHIQVLPVKK